MRYVLLRVTVKNTQQCHFKMECNEDRILKFNKQLTVSCSYGLLCRKDADQTQQKKEP